MKSTATALLLTAALLAGAPAAGNAADFFSLHVGGGHFGFSVSNNDWGVYRDCWYDQRWTPDFDATLAGYGEWVWVSGLGRVWRPWVTSDWRPYTHGRWVYSDLGWTWVSFEPWGYLPHHFGEWAYTAHGWTWVPGYTYHPARVVWVQDGSWLGWYPPAPRGWSHANHHAYDRGYRNGYWNGWNDARHATWVQWKNMGSENLAAHAVSSQALRSRGARTPGTLAHGPHQDQVHRHGGRIERTVMEQRRVTVSGRNVTMARPKGMAEVVERHAAPTAQRVLTNVNRRGAAHTEAGQPDRGTSSAHRSSLPEQRASTHRTPLRTTDTSSRATDIVRTEAPAKDRGPQTMRRTPSSTQPPRRITTTSISGDTGRLSAARTAAQVQRGTDVKVRERDVQRSVGSASRSTTSSAVESIRASHRSSDREVDPERMKRAITNEEGRRRPTTANRGQSAANAQQRRNNQHRR